ncbi:MAG TPA: hypothetical protein VLK35_11210 [Methylomirabilota bacterium]|nr:hypothetical protein [Methylomirabilota bacterium]
MRGFATLLMLGLLAGTADQTGAASPIINAPTVLQQSPAAIQASLGRPIRTKTVAPGDVHLPEGGTSRAYTAHGTRIDIDFEQERSTTVVIVFPDASLAPRTYEAALEAVNLRSGPRPDMVRRDRREWHNLDGYFVRVIAAYPALDHIDAIVLSTHPLP